jgi:hypothetical protein
MRGRSALNSVMRWRCRWTPGGWCLSMAAIIQLSDDLAASGVEVRR